MTSGLPGELTAFANAWTAASTWSVLSASAAAGLVVVALRAVAFLSRLRDDGEDARDARFDVAIAALLFLVALALRLLWPERVHYTFNDEYEYVDYARRLLASGVYGLPSGPPAGVYLYAVACSMGAGCAASAFATTVVAGSATPPVLYGLLRLLRVERAVAIVAAVLLALAPLHVKHSASASLEVLALLFMLLALATFVAWLRTPTFVHALGFAVSLFFTLTVRVEGWLLLLLLPLLAWPLRPQRPPRAQILLVVAALVLAAAYLPGILAAPIRYEPWWRSRLPASSLLATNLAFWWGDDAARRKLPLLLAAIGLVASLRRSPRVALLWLAFALVYSLAFVAYGLNVGWVEEAHQPPPWGARGDGHDMFRFNVLLLPVVTFLLASGLVALARCAVALLRGRGAVASWRPPVRHAALAGGALALVGLLLSDGEARSYHPLRFVASRYNRAFEIAELRFLEDAASHVGEDARCYVLPPAEGVVVDGCTVRPLAELDGDLRADPTRPALAYVNARQLARPELRAPFAALQRRHALREVARARDGRDEFYLFAVSPDGGADAGASAGAGGARPR